MGEGKDMKVVTLDLVLCEPGQKLNFYGLN